MKRCRVNGSRTSDRKRKVKRKMGERSSSSSSSSSSSLFLSSDSSSCSSSSSHRTVYLPSAPLLSPPSSPESSSGALPASPAVYSRSTNAHSNRLYNRIHTYQKKRNISGDGTLYERNFATICFLRGIHRHKDFYLTAAVDALHPFDDVQFETLDRKSLRSSVIQLKHKHGKTLTQEAFQGFRGEQSKRRSRDKSFVIHIFHTGFCKIRDLADEMQQEFGFVNSFQNWEFILYTNCAVDESGAKAVATIGCGNRDIATCDERSSNGTGCFLLKDTYKPWQRFSPDFLDKFRLYAGQAGENDMEQIIHDEITANKRAWGEDPTEVIAYNLCNFIEKWLTKETLPLDASIKDKFLRKLQIKKESKGYVPWFPLD